MNDIQGGIKKKTEELEGLKAIEERLKLWGNKPIGIGTCFFFEARNKYCCVYSCSDASDCVSRYGVLWARTDDGITNRENEIGEGETTEGTILEHCDPIDFETFNDHYQYAKNALDNLRLKIKFSET